MNTLTFNEVNFNPINNNGQIWLTSAEIAKALGYSRTDKISGLYNRNKDEFTDTMTTTVEMFVEGFGGGNSKKPVRIFSLRGCHALAMFARTIVAKQFRKWVLDILDKEVGKPVQPTQLSTVADRKHLKDAVNFYCAKTGSIQSEIWKMVHQRFNLENVSQMTVDQVPPATEYVHGFILQAKQVKEIEVNSDNEFWRYVGIIKHQELTQALRNAKDVMNNLHQAIGSAQSHSGLIYDAFGEQQRRSGLGKDGHHEAYIKAQEFIAKQDVLMAHSRF